ncbi:hypothetical protein AR438_03645 [Chryseobacterium aquaticum]|uniref:Glycosyltransferase 2-like domain-containing protein n=2 Tax=Chryseobacterium aquaticum TaxID=452084 RepID=A0A0Q3HWS3_9FLAO|nr:hypothetical protein AR438_03645 [Chryseobacterium aquaticum]
MMKNLVSIIIPNYNHAPYLKQRIDSVLGQTFQDFEVIILDDVSPDNSKEIIEQYRSHPKVSHIIYNEENSGSTFKQWKKGIDLARGEWVWIAESDDWCENTFLENLINLSEKHPSVGLAYCSSVFFNESDNSLTPQIATKNISEFILSNEFIHQKLIPFNGIVNASAVIFKKALYYNVSNHYTSFKLAGDWIFWAEISQMADVAICGKFLNYFRQHDIKVSMNSLKNGFNYKEEIDTLKYFKSTLGISEEAYNQSLVKQYLRFKYNKFPFNEGVIDRTEKLFQENLSLYQRKEIRKIDLKNKLEYKYLPKFLKLFFK